MYAVGLDGANKQRLTKAAGTHSISLAPNAAYYLDDYSSLSSPAAKNAYTSRMARNARANARIVPAPDTHPNEFDILPTEIVKVKASDGTLLYARMIKPAGFEAGKKYPAVVIVYGGPGAQ